MRRPSTFSSCLLPTALPTNTCHSTSTSPAPLNPALFKLKILDALKNNNYDQLKQLVASIRNGANQYEALLLKNLVLNLAVQVASAKMVHRLLNERDLSIDINHQDNEGNTALHIAAASNRLDVAQLLLRDARINDTLMNDDNKQPIDLAKDLNMVELLQFERSRYVEKVAVEFRNAFTSHDFAALDEILSQPRNYELLDINGNDPETGDTVLHEFIKKNDIGMVQWILSHGGDPFKRDRKGRLPIELCGKTNETMKNILRDASKDQTVINMDKVGGMEAPTYKGYLRKWTNFAGGYKLRWFVLDSNGILSYYKSQDDTNNACRGSLNMKSALLHLDSSEKMKFEIIGVTGIRWHLKGNHPIETNRWVWSLQGAIRYAKDKEKALKKASLGLDVAVSRKSQEITRQHSRTPSSVSLKTVALESQLASLQRPSRPQRAGSIVSQEIINDSDDDDEYDDDDDDDDSTDYNTRQADENENVDNDNGPHAQEISVLKSSMAIELNSLKDLLQNIQKTGSTDESVQYSLNSVVSVISSFNEFSHLVAKRDEKLLKALRKQRDINELWINSIRDLENELMERNNELETFESERRQIKKVLTKRFGHSAQSLEPDTAIATATEGSNDEITQEESAAAEISKFLQDEEDSDDEFFDAADFSEDEEEVVEEVDVVYETSSVAVPAIEVTDTETPHLDEGPVENTAGEETVDLEYTNSLQKEKHQIIERERSFAGYEDPPRTELPLKVDERPAVSLWGILKSMIGKDITKITLPVAFNEPTSMLQRLVEDFEYSSLLDQACSFEDPTLRMLYIGVFAVSQYSSTIGRVAKPFNPLLGETYEYARPEVGYRFFTEQVSHHPPISAVIVEHPKWDYYGETSVKSGFNGRSFDVQPTATWYMHVRPDHGPQEEVYSWRKLKTSVVGIIVGNPTIDNYGEIEITNHTTGEKCVINCIPRGWRASQAYELNGHVFDKFGEKKWAIGGHWNSKIYGKRIGKNDSKADKKSAVHSTGPTEDGSKFLIWSPVPRPTVPFNLTTFAISLNAKPEHLIEWLPDSDTRLRPDQRAMEDGLYDDAGELKSKLEDKQRTSRKRRDEAGDVYKPRFFAKDVHPVTGGEYWKFNGQYWRMRSEKNLPKIDIF